MRVIKSIGIDKLKTFILDRQVLDGLSKKKEVALFIGDLESKRIDFVKNPLLDIEVALKKCERLGVFKK